jgi:serine/threonine protein phosphatase PrpC
MDFKSFGFSDPGKINKNNEDNFICNNDEGLFLVADGMGGHASGETASKMTVETVNEFVIASRANEITWPIKPRKDLSQEANRLLAGVYLSHLRIKKSGDADPSMKGMGTTVSGAIIDGDNLAVVNLGDSRLYRIRDGGIQQLTTDHNLAMEHMKNGIISESEIDHHPFRHVLTRALGHINSSSKIDIFNSEILKNDMYLICSDGLYNMLDDKKILKIIGAVQDKSLYKIGLSLVLEANLAGGIDNITVVLLTFQ